MPENDFITRYPRFGDSRNVWLGGKSRGRRHGKRAQPSRPHVGQYGRGAGEHRVRMSAEGVGERRTRALVRDVSHLDPRHACKQLAGEMAATAGARRREANLGRPRLRQRDQLFNVFHR